MSAKTRPIVRDTSLQPMPGDADGIYARGEVEPARIESANGMVPPFDAAAEKTTLGMMMLEFEWLSAAIDKLKPADFYAIAHQHVFTAILTLVKQGRAPDRNTVRAWLADHDKLRAVGGEEYISSLVLAPGYGSTTATIERILETSLIRRAIAAGHRVAAEGYHCVGNPREWIQNHATTFSDLAETTGTTAGYEAAPTIGERVFLELNTRINPDHFPNRPPLVYTGMHDLDRLAGPLRPGLTVIAAWSGVGKSSLAREWALRIVRNKSKRCGIIIVTLEMSADELIMAMAYSIAGVDSSKLDAIQRLTPDEMTDLAAACHHIRSIPWLWIADQKTLAGKTPRHIEALSRRIQMTDAPKVGVEVAATFVDYLQLASAEVEKGANREREITSIAYGLHNSGERLGIPMVALSQLNEDGKKRKDGRPCAEDARESKGIVQAAKRVILVHNTHYLERRRKMQEERGAYVAPDFEDVEIIVDKNRGGRTGIVPARFLPWCTRFDDIPEGEKVRPNEAQS